MTDGPRAQLIHIETDRRLGHEWDEWDGRPLPGGGDFSAPPGLFFRYAVLTMGVSGAALVGLLYVLAPRLSLLSAALPQRLAWVLVGALAVAALWFGILLLTFYGGATPLPERLLEDRKSTRLNSSHTVISYAVFCLKKKKQRILGTCP